MKNRKKEPKKVKVTQQTDNTVTFYNRNTNITSDLWYNLEEMI